MALQVGRGVGARGRGMWGSAAREPRQAAPQPRPSSGLQRQHPVDVQLLLLPRPALSPPSHPSCLPPQAYTDGLLGSEALHRVCIAAAADFRRVWARYGGRHAGRNLGKALKHLNTGGAGGWAACGAAVGVPGAGCAAGAPRLAARRACRCWPGGEQLPRRLGARLALSSDLRTRLGCACCTPAGAGAAAPPPPPPRPAAAWWLSSMADALRSTARGEASSPEKPAGVMLPDPASLTAKPLAAPEGAPVDAGGAACTAMASGSGPSGDAARGEA